MLKNPTHKNYLIFGGSIIATRALEYLVLFFAAHYMSKDNYGELEYYKKLIEVGSSVFAFGFPALILSYTKSKQSKLYFCFLSVLFVFFIAFVSFLILGILNWLFLLIPFIFYALFFNGGITPAYLLVMKGSNSASFYKIIISILFYLILFVSIYYFDVTGMAYVVTTYVLSPLAIIYIIYEFFKQKVLKVKAKKYWRLFKKLERHFQTTSSSLKSRNENLTTSPISIGKNCHSRTNVILTSIPYICCCGWHFRLSRSTNSRPSFRS